MADGDSPAPSGSHQQLYAVMALSLHGSLRGKPSTAFCHNPSNTDAARPNADVPVDRHSPRASINLMVHRIHGSKSAHNRPYVVVTRRKPQRFQRRFVSAMAERRVWRYAQLRLVPCGGSELNLPG